MAESEAITKPPRSDGKAYSHWHYMHNRDKVLARQKARRLADPEHFKKIATKSKALHPEPARKAFRKWYHANKEYNSKRYRAYRLANHERLKEQERNRSRRTYPGRKRLLAERNKMWRLKNPHHIVHASQKRRALKRLATINQTSILQWMEIVKSKHYAVCYYCQRRVKTDNIHFDHIVALSKGGPHCVENLCVSCPSCNLSKGNKAVRTWIKCGQQIMEL